MTPFLECDAIWQGVCCTLLFLLLCGGLCATILAAIYRTKALHIALCALPPVVLLMLLLLLMDGMDLNFSGDLTPPVEQWFWALPMGLLFVLTALMAAYLAHAMIRLFAWRRSHISQTSVKESIDQLPTGLCFHGEGGLPRLVNRQMNALCMELTGEPLLNAEAFWQALTTGDVLDPDAALQTGDVPIVRTGDMRVWSFERTPIDANGERAQQIIASDITREYEMNDRLRSENLRLAEMNRRLRQYGENVQALTREKETLAAKVRIHDELGQALLATRRLTIQPSSPAQRAEVLHLWRQNLKLLQGTRDTLPETKGFAQLIAAAQAIGVRVILRGAQPPSDAVWIPLLENAIHECLTNTVRHARGTKLYIDIAQTGAATEITCTNNGALPRGPVVEGGGLSSLRRRVEYAGGSMSVRSNPRFALHISLPTESEEWP